MSSPIGEQQSQYAKRQEKRVDGNAIHDALKEDVAEPGREEGDVGSTQNGTPIACCSATYICERSVANPCDCRYLRLLGPTRRD